MSAEAIRDAIAREAAAAEAEEPTPGGKPEPEPTPEPEPEPTPEPEAVARAVDPKAVERAIRNHAKAMARVLGVEVAALPTCSTCDGVGYTAEPPEEVPEVKADPDTEACPQCNGYGQVLTGAREPADPTRPCTMCAGGGYVTKQATLPTQTQPVYTGNGETSYTPPPPAVPVDPVALAQLRAAGYTVIDPIVPASAPPA